MNHTQRWARWTGWLETIYHDVVGMLASRQIWRHVNETLGSAPTEVTSRGGMFQSWMFTGYKETQALAVRRQTDVRTDVVSLGRLIQEVAAFPQVISRDRFLASHRPDDRGMAQGFYDNLVGAGLSSLPRAAPEADLARLSAGVEHIRTWVDKEIAHWDPRRGEFSAGLTFGDLHASIDLIFEMMNRYRCLLAIGNVHDEVGLPPGWTRVFEWAWAPQAERNRPPPRSVPGA